MEMFEQFKCPSCDESVTYVSFTIFRVRRTRSRGDTVELAKWTFLFVLALWCITITDAMEAHISVSDPGGLIVFNASLGPGWTYRVEYYKNRSSNYAFLELDSSTGVLYWRGNVRCLNLRDNPIHVNIISSTWHILSTTVVNVTELPYSIFVHGCETTIKSRKPDVDVHKISVGVNIGLSQCIQPLTHLLGLTDFIPINLRQCMIDVDEILSSPLVADDRLVFSSAVKICFNNGSFSVDFALSLMCDSAQLFHLPFRLTMHPYLNKQAHRRYRRAANNRPKFSPTAYTENVKEEQPPGVQVVTITATDTDTEGAGTLAYTMASTRDDRSQSMFAINPLTGTINTTQKLDREFIKAHYFIVIATDHGVPPESASASLTIIVDDVNDHAPRFDQDIYSINFSEGQVVGYPVLTIQATDQDFGKNAELRYSIANPEAPNDAFMIDPVTGAITTMAILDREKLSSFRLLIQAVDQGDVLSERRSSTATVIIQITDENDNSPIFSQQSYQVTVREDQNVSLTVPIIQVNATDADAGKNAEIQYQLSGNNLQKFRIDPVNGKLFLIEQLNYEETQEFSLTVRAEDQGTPSKRTSVTILVRVLDINDNPPKFILDVYEGMVTENVDVDTSILQVQAFDADSGVNSQLTYSFVGEGSNSSLPFVIDSKSAWIRTSGNIDRETRSVYNLKIKAVDNGIPQLSATTSVVITVRDINDNAPIFQSRAYDASVSEEAKIGEEVVRVLAVDLDDSENARVVYAITDGNLGESFQMGQSLNEGVISVHKQLDARQFNRFTLTVSATDSGGRKDTVQVFINVTDTNRNAPEFQGTPYHFNVQENIAIGTSVFKVNAIDKDRGENARITYSMDPGISAFAIDPNNGVISTRAPLDRESVPAYTLKVTATDNGKPQLMDTEVIDVTIDDQNDNKPEFTEITYNGHIAEDALPGERVLRITATDRDKDSNGQVIYTFDKGNDGSGDFSIDSALGWIRVAKNLDRERIPSYELVAFAVDRGLNPQSSSVIIRIKIDDVNDNHPQFEAEEINVYITENSPIGSTVAHITATDPDEGLNALVEYSFEGGADVDSFQLSGRKGDPATITTLVNLDYESGKKKYEIILRAASDTQFSTAKIFINVRDVNDNAPILKDFLIIYNNFGGSFPIGPIGRIPASDPDVSDQELLSYQILSGNEASLLYLNSSTGQITLDSRLNSDVPRNGTFQVSVSDGKNVVRATCRLYVRLITPEMLRDSVTIRLDRMTQIAFLSSLLKFFTDALASIFHTEIANIYIINIEDDVDVPQAQILNVSVSVRQRTISVQGRTRDVFYSPEYLREYIYLYRSLLANLSALQVLPFDDNLCLQEPCANFAVCLSTVNEGIAMPFVASDTLLFRPIHPVNGYKCECPHGFAGMQLANACDVEIDLCYSIPCLNNGTCIPHESGYTCQCTSDFQGANCEVNMTTKYDAITCPQNFCQPPSVCVPLIRGGFRCDGCPDDGNYDKFCRLKTRNFRKGSYLTFPSLKKRNRFTVKLRFATQERNGLLLYNGRFNEEHDFIGLEIVNSQVVFSFSLGGNHTSVSAYTPGGVSTGDWFQVTVQYHQREAILIVGGDCDTNIAILYGDKLDNYSCAAKVSHTLPAFCDNPTENCYRLLDLTGPLQLGGLPWAPSAGQVTQNNFIGCISEVYLDDELLDLNTSVAGEFTSVGCQQKLTNCQSSPCTLGGKCKEGWTTFTCDCPEKTGGKDCSQVIEASRQLTGNAYLFYENVAQNIVYYPWYNGLAFRTRAKSGILMQVVLNGDQVVKMQLQDGFVRYSYRENVIDVDSARVNDGQWHYVEARWYAGYVEILLDYGQRQKTMAVTASVSGSSIQRIYVGGFQGGSGPVLEGFVGCVKDVRVGNNPNAILSRPTETGEIRSGCSQAEACDSNPCGPGTCQDLWGASKCLCPPGTIGPRCENICRQYNPCENWAECQQPLPGATTYACACGSRQSGRYCENMAPLTCPAAWWGDSVCGPCNCDQRKGFESNCNKTNGMCYCKDLHYQLPGEDQCYPCDCYTEGSLGQSCDHNTGQCQCQDGVIGRRCDQCDNIFAGINLSKNTCEIMSYEECPRNYAQKIWWEPVAFGQTAVQDCPPGASGSAKRECAEKTSWLVADLFNCTSDNFTKLASQLADFEAGAISPYSADLAVELLKNATNTTKPLYGGDILMTLNFAMVILKYENNQTGLGLISQQYRDFVQQLVIALSNVTSLENAEFWPRINEMYQGAATLLYLLEQYLLKIATIMPQAQSSPFEVVSDEIVLGADWMTLNNISEHSVPKYDNNVNKGSADKFASIKIPSSLFLGAAQGIQEAKSYFGYAIYHSMGKLMVMNTDNTIRRTGLPLTVNGPVFTFVVISQGKQVSGPLSDPVYVRLKLASPSNKTNLQCATWTANSDGRGLWSGSYCSVLDTDCLVTGVDADECLEIYITCKCFHLSTFAVLVDQEDGTAIQQAIVQLEVITYILVGVSLTLLFVVFFILISYKTIYCNWNSIHVNLVFVIFLSELAFVVGINRTTPELFCRLVAIALHYFYMSAFAWLYVEVLHIYRLLTEKHTINYGSMKFYYLLGYVIPGIIVGLAVGLYTDGYGNDSFCWLETSELLIWSFAGPIVVVVVLNIITFMFALKASCREKVNVSDISAIKLGLMGAILLLLLLSITWVLGLLTVNFDIAALGYVHAIFVFLQGTFLFIIYILLAQKVRLCLKRTWYRLRGKKFGMDDGLSGTRSSVASRSALAYRNDSSPDTGFRINVGISTTSTTSQSSKSTGRYRPPHYKDDDFGRSTSSSTSGHVPSGSTYPHNTGIAPYGYEPSAGDALPEEEYAEQSVPKIGGNDSESDSDASAGGNSLDLASSHSSDEDDEFEIGLSWEQQVPKSIKVEQAREQLEKQRKDKERERLGNNNSDIHWVDSSQVDVGVDLDPQPISRPHTSSVPPDVTLSAAAQRTGRKVTIVPPPRTDSLQNNYTGSSNAPSDTGTSSRVKVQVLTHNGSLSSDSESESSGETNV